MLVVVRENEFTLVYYYWNYIFSKGLGYILNVSTIIGIGFKCPKNDWEIL